MDGVALLREARAAGLVIGHDGEQLLIQGPKAAGDLARRLLNCKSDVLMVLLFDAAAVDVESLQDLNERQAGALWDRLDAAFAARDFKKVRQVREEAAAALSNLVFGSGQQLELLRV